MVRLYKKTNVFMHLILEDIFKKNKIRLYPKRPYDFVFNTNNQTPNYLFI